jgi:hypothetical protein
MDIRKSIIGEYYINIKKEQPYKLTRSSFNGYKIKVPSDKPIATGGSAKVFKTDNEEYLMKLYDSPGSLMFEKSIYSYIWQSTANYPFNTQFCKIYEVSVDGRKAIDKNILAVLAIENRGTTISKIYPLIEKQLSNIDKLTIFLQIVHGFTFLLHSCFVEHQDITDNNVLLKILDEPIVMKVKIFNKDILLCTKYLVTIIDFIGAAFLLVKSHEEKMELIDNTSVDILSTILVPFRHILPRKYIGGMYCRLETVKSLLTKKGIHELIYKKYQKDQFVIQKIQEYLSSEQMLQLLPFTSMYNNLPHPSLKKEEKPLLPIPISIEINDRQQDYYLFSQLIAQTQLDLMNNLANKLQEVSEVYALTATHCKKFCEAVNTFDKALTMINTTKLLDGNDLLNK